MGFRVRDTLPRLGQTVDRWDDVCSYGLLDVLNSRIISLNGVVTHSNGGLVALHSAYFA